MPNTKRLPTAQVDLARRVVGLLNLYRLLIPPALLGIQWLTEPTPSVGGAYPTLFLAVGALYLAAGVVFVLAQRYRGLSLRQVTLAQSIVDSAAIALLLYSSGGVASGIGILLVLTVGATALLAEDRDAFLMAAIASLAVLVQQIAGQAAGSASENDYPSAGVLGTIIFLVALGAWVLARRLRESEALVRRQEIDLENLAQLSQYVVQHLRESILVIDSDDRIRLINESAAHMLSDDSAFPGAHVGDASPRLQQLLNLWRSDQRPGAHSAGTLVADEGGRVIQPHFAPLGSANPAPVLVFLEDTAQLATQVQQSKLAALGRLSASIAHEIRNPVGAMSHAAQLLQESPGIGAEDRRLCDIISRNGATVSQIVDAVLTMSRRGASRPETIDIAQWLEGFRAEFCATMQFPAERLRLAVTEPLALEVRMDPAHLRQIAWNLCENAMRHGLRDQPEGVIELRWGRLKPSMRPFLEVADSGPGIDAALVERVFEPFFTGSEQGSGLGLFLARELAQTNSATLLHESPKTGGSLFRIVFTDPQRWES